MMVRRGLLVSVLGAAMGALDPVDEPALLRGWREATTDHEEPEELRFLVHAAEEYGGVEGVALSVSTPGDAEYGRYRSRGEVEALAVFVDYDACAAWVASSRCEASSTSLGLWEVACATVEDAEAFLRTTFRPVERDDDGAVAWRASTYLAPSSAVVFGAHGLPAPRRETTYGNAAPVTPEVLRRTYNVTGGPASRRAANRQAVVEFEGQTYNSSDLERFFKTYVGDYEVGRDDRVSASVGDPGDGRGDTEPSLDVQYLMGVSPGVVSEFWMYRGKDFCLDLKNWSSSLLALDAPPLVHSVSYGWQGNLSQIGCAPPSVASVEGDFAKLAARGVSVLVSSGDDGAAWSPPQVLCGDNDSVVRGRQLDGVSKRTTTKPSWKECCGAAQHYDGFTYVPPDRDSVAEPQCVDTPGHTLEGTVHQNHSGVRSSQACCELSFMTGVGYAYLSASKTCLVYSYVAGTVAREGASSGTHPKMGGNCTLYDTVAGTRAGPSDAISGGKVIAPLTKAAMWPSWPASSPWVTAVGATRFADNTVGNDQEASGSFGSGGGFSPFLRRANATYQEAAVAEYLAGPATRASIFPPNGSFSPAGRATPDVSALGEGYQIVVNGKRLSVAGTSASTPVFAGFVSLLNDARLARSKPPMGFLNPFLYAHPHVFTDVTVGDNAITRNGRRVKYGFNATRGWDPVTGLGTPVFDKMLAAVAA